MSIEALGDGSRWWRVHGRDIDLQAEAGTYPPHLRAWILAARDADDEAGYDAAAFAEALTAGQVTDPTAARIVTQWLFTRSQAIVARAHTRPHAIDPESTRAA